jgi:hypothetical protein
MDRITRRSRSRCTIPTKLPCWTIIGEVQLSPFGLELMNRLKVPSIRSYIEYINFLILFILYVVAMEGLDQEHLNIRELVFIIYALGELPSFTE